MTHCTAFQITEEDIESVLHQYALRVANSRGLSFAAMAEELLYEIDEQRVEKAALKAGTDLDTQTAAAMEEIHAILVEQGVLEF